MKKFLLTAATAAAALTAFSADKFYVIMKDGSVESYPTEKVDSISFNDPQIEKIMGFGDMMQEIAKLKEEIAALKAGSSSSASSDFRYFVLNDKEVEIIGIKNASYDLVIPETVVLDGKTYTVTSIGEDAFDSSEEIVSKVKSVVLPNTLKNIEGWAFSYFESLESISIPASVTSIGDAVWSDCKKLTNIDVDANNPNFTSVNGVLYNKEKTELLFCPNGIKGEFEIPSSVTKIRNNAFDGCKNLTLITIPSSVTSIGGRVFEYCRNADVVIDNSPENIKFYNITWIDDVERVVEEVDYENTDAFYDCNSVKWTKWSPAGPVSPASPEIQVEAGGQYEAINEALGLNFTFKVVRVEGSYFAKDQVVTITIDGYDGELTLSDAGNSYLMYDGSVFITAGRATAIKNPILVFAVLACANSNANYTITSATLNDTMKASGATETKFRKKK
ncbi:MAG: leucine-rich repeat domain-containing protein [Paludibacteraceae bacterium]|nr:leucine-rich repeat domain-containing protein [Paludibacteraceae bacterium]